MPTRGTRTHRDNRPRRRRHRLSLPPAGGPRHPRQGESLSFPPGDTWVPGKQGEPSEDRQDVGAEEGHPYPCWGSPCGGDSSVGVLRSSGTGCSDREVPGLCCLNICPAAGRFLLVNVSVCAPRHSTVGQSRRRERCGPRRLMEQPCVHFPGVGCSRGHIVLAEGPPGTRCSSYPSPGRVPLLRTPRLERDGSPRTGTSGDF